MQIAFIGIGKVGLALADHLQRLGYPVSIAARDLNSARVRAARQKNPALTAKPLQQAVAEAEVVFLATPYDENEDALNAAGDLAGKIIVDCTNPIGPGLTHGLDSAASGGEQVQAQVPDARVVKAFNIYGYKNFLDTAYPAYRDAKPAMLIAGNDLGAKQVVIELCRALGWDVVDTGDISMSLHLEHMVLLWIRMSRERGSNFVWSLLER